MQCQNNLKQIGIALHAHHDVRKVLPPGGMQTGVNGTACWQADSGQAFTDQACKRSWGSNHDNGLNFLMCDGSVRWVTYSTDVNILAAMATIAGGEVAQLPD